MNEDLRDDFLVTLGNAVVALSGVFYLQTLVNQADLLEDAWPDTHDARLLLELIGAVGSKLSMLDPDEEEVTAQEASDEVRRLMLVKLKTMIESALEKADIPEKLREELRGMSLRDQLRGAKT